MTLNFVPILPALQQQFTDKTTGLPLAAGILRFFEDENQTIPKEVYELVGTGPGNYTYVSLGTEIVLSGFGTLVDHNESAILIYLWPWTGSPNDNPPSEIAQNYYITVTSSTGVFQEDFHNVPGVLTSTNPDINDFDTTENIISNGQFVDVLFSTTSTQGSPTVKTTSGSNTSTPIAPDWNVVTSGSGTLSLWRVPITDETAPGNPAYALGIINSGYSQPIQVVQTIQSPRILAGRYASGTFIADTTGSTYTISMTYTPSITGTTQTICSGTPTISGFTEISGTALITEPGAGTGSVNIAIVIPVGATVILSCIQLCGVTDVNELLPYLEETPEREVDHLFHYFQPDINFKPTPSYLVGWDFPLNPAQFGDSGSLSTIGANKGAYVWDQTIAYQTVNNSVSYASAANGDLVLGATANTQMAVIQYLAAPEIFEILANNLSVSATFSTSSVATATISLWYTTNASLPNVTAGTNNTVVTALDANGYPSVASGWVEIKRPFGNATFTTPNGLADFQAATVNFSGWPSLGYTISSSATFFAIVLGTSTITNGSVMQLHQISLVPGNIPTIAAPKTFEQVFNDCQYYYEKSYPSATALGAMTNTGIKTAMQQEQNSGGNSNTINAAFELRFNVIKRTTSPTVHLYSPITGTIDNVFAVIQTSTAITVIGADAAVGTYWTPTGLSSKGITYIPPSAAVIATVATGGTTAWTAYITYHYLCDARLGIV